MSFFKAYDMRGAFGTDFTLDTVYRVARWLPVVLGAKRFLIGRDMRLTSSDIRDTLVRGLVEAGCTVDDLGLATTPMVYFFTGTDDYDASVQITASHNPPAHNGMKVSKRGALPVGYDAGLGAVEQHVLSGELPPPAAVAGSVTQIDERAAYVAWLTARRTDFSNLRFAVDCSDGAAGLFARRLFGDAPLYINDTPDGAFPHHSPNPLDPASREQLAALVREKGLDLGVIFDGDADRVMFVDEHGDFIQPDYLIPVIAKKYLAAEPGAWVIHDIRTSRGAIEALHAMGARTQMGKVGHAYAKVALHELNAVCGGELAGHYYFRDFVYCDSGEFAALRVLDAVATAKREGLTFSALMKPICVYANSGELNFKIEQKDEAIAAVLKTAATFGEETGRATFDGVRIEFAEGWINVRKSNTEPYLRLIIEASTSERLKAWQDALTATVKEFQ